MDVSSFYIVFSGLFILNVYFCINRDDDVVYIIMDRKPSGSEAIRRIRYVVVKLILSVYGGGILSILVKKKILDRYQELSGFSHHKMFIIFSFMVFFWGGLGIIQNGIRLIQKRKTRPLYDINILMYNLHIRR